MMQENVSVKDLNMMAKQAIEEMPKKKDEPWSGAFSFCLLGIGLLYLLGDYSFGKWGGLIFLALGGLMLYASYSAHQYNANEYPRRMAEFDRKYICKRCGTVFTV
ncbi:MAG: hypothetical protein IJ849_08770 [Selenomonadaceae bacterium]|nr:hypothetical protein [Selenomonadaceae bacterium]